MTIAHSTLITILTISTIITVRGFSPISQPHSQRISRGSSCISDKPSLTRSTPLLLPFSSTPKKKTLLFSSEASSSINSGNDGTTLLMDKDEIRSKIKAEGGRLAFNTKYGALNPFAIYYGLTSILLGIVWFTALSLSQIFYMVTRNRFDRNRRIPVILNYFWGSTLARITGLRPTIENREILTDFYKSNRSAMFVSNHQSWMDIIWCGLTIGWKNYKFVAKKELEKVPILGKAIKVAGNVSVDRTNRRSQIATLKSGMKYLKDGVFLVTYPEGTRTKTGRMGPFKNGAFKMAHKVGAPVVPFIIEGGEKVMPYYWMFPMRSSRGGLAKVKVLEPIESNDKTEEELVDAVRNAMIEALPESQKPL